MPYKDLEKRRQKQRNLYQRRVNNGICWVCGKPTERKVSRCQSCHDKSLARRMAYRQSLKRRAVEYLGGQCTDCGMKTDILAVYDFHHIQPGKKDAEPATMMDNNRSWEEIQAELDMCIVLCANCHRIRHALQDDD